MADNDLEQYKIRLPEGTKFFVKQAAQVRGFTSMSEYTRQLLYQDMEEALDNFDREELTKRYDETDSK